MRLQTFVKDALPFVVMASWECLEVAMLTLGKAAMSAGMSNLVYVFYYNVLGVLVLLPHYILHRRRSDLLPLNLSLVWRFFILGFLGIFLVQVLAYAGINYSSPVLAMAIGNLLPAFTFLLAIFFRMENLNLEKSSSQAKSLGTIVAISGAFTLTLYKGPTLLNASMGTDSVQSYLMSQPSDWELGGLIMTISCFLAAAWYVLQTATVEEYPDATTVIFISLSVGTVLCGILTVILERNPDAWKLQPSIKIVGVVFAALVGVSYYRHIVTWCLNKKGPLFVTMFKPLGIIVAMIAGVAFAGDALYLGSLIGAAIIVSGFYTVMWGKAREEDGLIEVEEIVHVRGSPDQTPLLQP